MSHGISESGNKEDSACRSTIYVNRVEKHGGQCSRLCRDVNFDDDFKPVELLLDASSLIILVSACLQVCILGKYDDAEVELNCRAAMQYYLESRRSLRLVILSWE